MLCAYWLTNYCMGGKQWSQWFQALLLHCLSTALCKWLTLFQTKDFTIQYIMYSLPGSAIIPEDKAIHVGLLNSLCWRLFLWMVTDTCHLGTFMWLKRLLWLTHFTVNFIKKKGYCRDFLCNKITSPNCPIKWILFIYIITKFSSGFNPFGPSLYEVRHTAVLKIIGNDSRGSVQTL